MPEHQILLNGADEGINVIVTSSVSGAESPNLVLKSIQTIFPQFDCEIPLTEPSFGKPSQMIFQAENLSINYFLNLVHKQSILDTTLDVITANLDNNYTFFEILRQASIVGKVAYNIPGNLALGGVIKVELAGEDLAAWIEAATWHKGRDSIPRRVHDDWTMNDDGDAVTWH